MSQPKRDLDGFPIESRPKKYCGYTLQMIIDEVASRTGFVITESTAEDIIEFMKNDEDLQNMIHITMLRGATEVIRNKPDPDDWTGDLNPPHEPFED